MEDVPVPIDMGEETYEYDENNNRIKNIDSDGTTLMGYATHDYN